MNRQVGGSFFFPEGGQGATYPTVMSPIAFMLSNDAFGIIDPRMSVVPGSAALANNATEVVVAATTAVRYYVTFVQFKSDIAGEIEFYNGSNLLYTATVTASVWYDVFFRPWGYLCNNNTGLILKNITGSAITLDYNLHYNTYSNL